MNKSFHQTDDIKKYLKRCQLIFFRNPEVLTRYLMIVNINQQRFLGQKGFKSQVMLVLFACFGAAKMISRKDCSLITASC